MNTYVIHLNRCPERLQHVRAQLDQFGIREGVTYIEAIDCEDWPNNHPDYDIAKAAKYLQRPMAPGEQACLASHLRAMQMIIDRGETWGLILEDDVQLQRNPVKELSGFPDSARFVTGSSQSDRLRQVVSREGRRVLLGYAPYGGYCYAVHRDLAAQCIAHLRQGLYMPLDVYLPRQSANKLGGYWQVEGVASEGGLGNRTTTIGDLIRRAPNQPGLRERDGSDRCPALIHQVWVGPHDVPSVGIESWQTMNPLRIHKLWREADIEPLVRRYGMYSVYRAYIDDEMWCGAADIARYVILHKHGGFYADADSIALRTLDVETPFFTYESETHRPGLIANGFAQCRAGHPIWMDALEAIGKLKHPIGASKLWELVGPGLVTELAKRYDIPAMPSRCFFPRHFEDPPGMPDPDGLKIEPFCDHQWGTTDDWRMHGQPAD